LAVAVVSFPGAGRAQECQSPSDLAIEVVGGPEFGGAGRDAVRLRLTVAVSGRRRSCDLFDYSFEIWTDEDRLTWSDERSLHLDGIAYRGQRKRFRVDAEIDGDARDVRLVWCLESFAWLGEGAPPCSSVALGDTPRGAAERRREEEEAAAAEAARLAEATRAAEEERRAREAAAEAFRQRVWEQLAAVQAALTAGRYDVAWTLAEQARGAMQAGDPSGEILGATLNGQLLALRVDAGTRMLFGRIDTADPTAPLPSDLLGPLHQLPNATQDLLWPQLVERLARRWLALCANATGVDVLTADLALLDPRETHVSMPEVAGHAASLCLGAIPPAWNALWAWARLGEQLSQLGLQWSSLPESVCWRLFSAWAEADADTRTAVRLPGASTTIDSFGLCLREPAHRRELAAAQVDFAVTQTGPNIEVELLRGLRLDPGNTSARECLLAGAAWRAMVGQAAPDDSARFGGAELARKEDELRGHLTSYWNLVLSVPVPGLGQMVTGRWHWGLAFLLGAVGLAGGGGLAYYLSSSAHDDYVAASAIGDSAASAYWDDVESYWYASLGLWIGAGIVWVLNLIDAGFGIQATRDRETTREWALRVGCPAVQHAEATAAMPLVCW
jgi:hypothetical protein